MTGRRQEAEAVGVKICRRESRYLNRENENVCDMFICNAMLSQQLALGYKFDSSESKCDSIVGVPEATISTHGRGGRPNIK